MNTRKLTTLAILALTILSADLLTEVIMHMIEKYTRSPNPYKATAISMVVAVAVFYPAFTFMEEWVKKTAQSYVKTSKAVTGNSRYGLWIAFCVGMLLLFAGYLKVRHNINWFGL